MQRTPLPPNLLIIEQFGVFDSCAQSGVQSAWDDTDSIGLVVLVLAAVIIFAAAVVTVLES